MGAQERGAVPGRAAALNGEALREFATARRLAAAEGEHVEPLTPLLARGAGLPLEPAFRGRLLGGGQATAGVLRYSGGHAVGAESDASFAFAVVITRVEGSERFAPRLFCRPQRREESLGGMGFELDDEALWTESIELAARYEVRTSPYQDPNWIRQLFSPTFIDWLVRTPEGFGFELAYGDLVGSLPAGALTVAGLEALWEATGSVAERIRAETLEGA